ncbi:MAG: ATP-binding protein, partial [Hyphomicrobiaceae bacterium]
SILGTLIVVFTVVAGIRHQMQTRRSQEQHNALELQKLLAESAAKDREDFLAVMSHEIRTPLNGLLGALELIRSSNTSNLPSPLLDLATASGETLLDLIDDVLLLSKAEQDKVALVREPFKVDALFASVARTVQPLTTQSGNRIDVRLPKEGVRPVLGDSRRLRQVLVNLVGNANKFTDDGRIEIVLEMIYEGTSGCTARISVTDTGIGIPEDKQRIIFDRFRTLDPSYTRRTDGTGLGLAICDILVRAMGGRISVRSEVGKGSCFWFDLDLAFAMQENAGTSPVTRSAERPHAGRPLRILLAEDNPTNAYITTQFLSDAGHTVQHAEDGQQAIAAASVAKFDLLLMDISMPEVDGIEAARAIRSSGSLNAATPMIALTAYADEKDRQKALDAGMDAYLSKPIRRQALLDALAQNATIGGVEAASEGERGIAGALIDRAELAIFVRERTTERTAKGLTIFIAELEQKIGMLRSAVSARNAKDIKAIAHSARGSGCFVGAALLVKKCSEIERTPIDGDATWVVAQELLEILEATLAAFRPFTDYRALTSFLGESADKCDGARATAASPDYQVKQLATG